MKLKGIKRNAVFKLLQKQQHKNKKNRPTLNKINKILVIAKEELYKSYDFTNKLSEDFKIDISDINVLLFQKIRTVNNLELYECFSDKSFSIFGKITDKNLNFILSKQYDLMINYGESDNVYTHLAALKSKSKFKAGFQNDYTTFYDFSVNIKDNKIDIFNEEIIKYLKILKLID